MGCPTKDSLVRKYNSSVRAYSEAIGQLISVESLGARAEWELAWELANRAQRLCQDALNQLKTHSAEHCC